MARPTGRRIFFSWHKFLSNNDLLSDRYRLNTLQQKDRNFPRWRRFARASGACAVFCAGLASCGGAPSPEVASADIRAADRRACGAGGYLQTELYGAVQAVVDWSAGDLECEGMPRPNGEGARLRFAGIASEIDRPIAFIIAMPALERGATAMELVSHVTLIEEGNGRFFGTADIDSCWTDVKSQVAVADSEDRYTIAGTLYCITALAETNGDANVTVPELRFTGLIDWSAK